MDPGSLQACREGSGPQLFELASIKLRGSGIKLGPKLAGGSSTPKKYFENKLDFLSCNRDTIGGKPGRIKPAA
jgi:hypothetical protein